jgi:hypothetical protein
LTVGGGARRTDGVERRGAVYFGWLRAGADLRAGAVRLGTLRLGA